MRGQISAEMLIIMVIMIGIAVIVAGQLLNTANIAGKEAENRACQAINIGKICGSDADCGDCGLACANGQCSI